MDMNKDDKNDLTEIPWLPLAGRKGNGKPSQPLLFCIIWIYDPVKRPRVNSIMVKFLEADRILSTAQRSLRVCGKDLGYCRRTITTICNIFPLSPINIAYSFGRMAK